LNTKFMRPKVQGVMILFTLSGIFFFFLFFIPIFSSTRVNSLKIYWISFPFCVVYDVVFRLLYAFQSMKNQCLLCKLYLNRLNCINERIYFSAYFLFTIHGSLPYDENEFSSYNREKWKFFFVSQQTFYMQILKMKFSFFFLKAKMIFHATLLFFPVK
jgi:hypothetical protein